MPWEITGNPNTDPSQDFLGTTDAEPLVIKTDSAERARVDTSGNFGIATSTPATPLHVNGNVTVSPSGGLRANVLLGATLAEGVSVISSDAVPSRTPALFTAGSDLVFSTFPQTSRLGTPETPPPAPAERARIDYDGNLGVGSTAPIAKLDVRGQGSFQGPVAINNREAAPGLGEPVNDSRAGLTFGATDTPSAFYVGAYTSTTREQTSVGVYSYQSEAWSQIWSTDGCVFPQDVSIGVGPAGVNSASRLQIAGSVLAAGPVTMEQGLTANADIVAEANIRVSGDVLLTGADCAEQFDVVGPLPPPGTVLVINDEGGLSISESEYDTRVAGVVSGGGDLRHAIVLDQRPAAKGRVPVAMLGKVWCKVDARSAPIGVGDLLTTSSFAGHAMRAEQPGRSFGAVLGKALRPLERGLGLIPILISLQ